MNSGDTKRRTTEVLRVFTDSTHYAFWWGVIPDKTPRTKARCATPAPSSQLIPVL